MRSTFPTDVKLKLLFTTLAALAPAFAADLKNCGCDCCNGNEMCCGVSELAANKTAEIKRHPLRGVITAVYVDRSALMVKHEEIPGVMRAMTMLFKVDATVLKSAQAGQTITGMMSRENDGWVLHDVKVVAPGAK